MNPIGVFDFMVHGLTSLIGVFMSPWILYPCVFIGLVWYIFFRGKGSKV